MSRFVYADHAATTALSDTALNAMLPYLKEEYGNPSSLYRFAGRAKAALEQARADVAACLNAKPEEIYFTSGGTEEAHHYLCHRTPRRPPYCAVSGEAGL